MRLTIVVVVAVVRSAIAAPYISSENENGLGTLGIAGTDSLVKSRPERRETAGQKEGLELREARLPPEAVGTVLMKSLPEVMQTAEGFSTHFLVEVVANNPVHGAFFESDIEGWHGPHDGRQPGPDFPRGWYKAYNENLFKWAYGAYSHTAVHYYHATHADPGHDHTKLCKHVGQEINISNDELEANPQAILLAFPLENYTTYNEIVIDPVLPIRAIYFPQLFNVSGSNSGDNNLADPTSSISQILFYRRNSVELPGETVPLKGELGFGHMNRTLVITNPMEAMLSLSLPENERDRSKPHPVYKHISLREPIEEPDKVIERGGRSKYEVELPTIYMSSKSWGRDQNHDKSDPLGANHVWAVHHASINDKQQYVSPSKDRASGYKAADFIISQALGTIPVLGPLLSVGFDSVREFMTDENQPETITALKAGNSAVLQTEYSFIQKLVEESGRILRTR